MIKKIIIYIVVMQHIKLNFMVHKQNGMDTNMEQVYVVYTFFFYHPYSPCTCYLSVYPFLIKWVIPMVYLRT